MKQQRGGSSKCIFGIFYDRDIQWTTGARHVKFGEEVLLDHKIFIHYEMLFMNQQLRT
jgi:hypothetical protein